MANSTVAWMWQRAASCGPLLQAPSAHSPPPPHTNNRMRTRLKGVVDNHAGVALVAVRCPRPQPALPRRPGAGHLRLQALVLQQRHVAAGGGGRGWAVQAVVHKQVKGRQACGSRPWCSTGESKLGAGTGGSARQLRGVRSCSLRARGLPKAAGLSLLLPWQRRPENMPAAQSPVCALALAAGCIPGVVQIWRLNFPHCAAAATVAHGALHRAGRGAHVVGAAAAHGRQHLHLPRRQRLQRGEGRGAGRGRGWVGASAARNGTPCCQHRVRARMEAGAPRLASPQLASPQLASRNASGTAAARPLTGMECRSRYVFSPFTTTYTLQGRVAGQGIDNRVTTSGNQGQLAWSWSRQ